MDEGPVEIKVDADNAVFKNYRSGIIKTPSCGQNAQHTVTAIGYDTDPATKTEFVIIKNIWDNWGENGKARISLDTKLAGPKGVCGIYNQ